MPAAREPRGSPREPLDLVATCGGCHTRSSATGQLTESLLSVREADRLTAAAVRVVESLHAEGRIELSDVVPGSADLLGLIDPPSRVEGELWTMVLVHRRQLVLGTFHQNPDFQQRLGWRELREDLEQIRAEAKRLRREPEREDYSDDRSSALDRSTEETSDGTRVTGSSTLKVEP